MVQGIGNDIIEISRVRASIARHGSHFLNKIFSKQEQEYCQKHRDPTPHFAGRFAAKEAIVKALGTGFRHGITWLDIDIQNDDYGKPIVVLSQELKGLLGEPKLLISISHCREYATAFAVLL
jgi:holo-[acyl-carrier protein] synthase